MQRVVKYCELIDLKRNSRRLRPRLLIRCDTSIAICEPLRCSDSVTAYVCLMDGHEISADRSKTYLPALSRQRFAQRESRMWRLLENHFCMSVFLVAASLVAVARCTLGNSHGDRSR